MSNDESPSDGLLEKTVKLALGCEQGAAQIINILLDTSLNPSNVGYHSVNAAQSVKNVCREILEAILQELELKMRAYEIQDSEQESNSLKNSSKKDSSGVNHSIPLLESIKQDLSLITLLLLSSSNLKVQTAVRLFSMLGVDNPNILVAAAAYVLRKSKSEFHLAAMLKMIYYNISHFSLKSDFDSIYFLPDYFTQAVEQATRDMQYNSFGDDCEAQRLFKNLSTLIK